MRVEWYIILKSMNAPSHGPYMCYKSANEQLKWLCPKEEYLIISNVIKEKGEV